MVQSSYKCFREIGTLLVRDGLRKGSNVGILFYDRTVLKKATHISMHTPNVVNVSVGTLQQE